MLPELNLRTVADVAAAAEITVRELEILRSTAPTFYNPFEVPKDNGGVRTITPSSGKLKIVQRRLLDHLNARIVWAKAVQGGIPKRSIFTNAKRHIGKLCVTTMDIAAFFPSTTPDIIQESLQEFGCAAEASLWIADLTTYHNELPQGAPTSTLLANLVLRRMDYRFIKLAERHDLTYSRYIDDLGISGSKPLDHFIGSFSDYVTSAGYRLADHKTRVQFRNQAQIVTKLVVNEILRPTTEYLSHLCATVRACWPGAAGAPILAAAEGKTLAQFRESLWGKINFVRSINPKRYQQLRSLMTRAILNEESDLHADALARGLDIQRP